MEGETGGTQTPPSSPEGEELKGDHEEHPAGKIKEALGGVKNRLAPKLEDVKEKLEDVKGKLGPKLGDVKEKVEENIGPTLDKAAGKLGHVVDDIKGKLGRHKEEE